MKLISFIKMERLAKNCNCDVADLLNQAAKGLLRLSLPFYGEIPVKIPFRCDSDAVQDIDMSSDSGLFDLHTEDAASLATYGHIAVETIFSQCGNWTVSFNPPRVVTPSIVVVRVEEAQDFQAKKVEAEVKPMSESERSRLLRQIGGMAMLIATKEKKYSHGTKPNANQIAESVKELLDAFPDFHSHGLGDTNLRESIREGIELLETPKK